MSDEDSLFAGSNSFPNVKCGQNEEVNGELPRAPRPPCRPAHRGLCSLLWLRVHSAHSGRSPSGRARAPRIWAVPRVHVKSQP